MQGKVSNYLGQNTYIYIFSGLVTGVIVFNLLRAVGFFTYCTKISVNMHNRMFSSLVRAPAKFFDENPSGNACHVPFIVLFENFQKLFKIICSEILTGRVMNRFTKDLGSMDELLPPTFFDMILVFSNVAGVFVLIIISNYYSVIPTVIILIVLAVMQRYYVCTARDVKRIEGVCKQFFKNYKQLWIVAFYTVFISS